MSLWFIYSFFMISFYCMDLRADILVPEMEKEINTLHDINFATTNIILSLQEATKLLMKDQSMLSYRVPDYGALSKESTLKVNEI